LIGHTNSLSEFQVKSPPSKNLKDPNCSSRTTLFLLSYVSAGLVLESVQNGLCWTEPEAGMNFCFAARHCSASPAAKQKFITASG